MPATAFVGVSVDGFLARPDDTYEFLMVGDGPPAGFAEFMETVDALVMGRRTYEVVRPKEVWPYGKRTRVVVLSHRELDLPVSGGEIEILSGEPEEIVRKLAASGATNLYIDGGITIQSFLRAGLVDRMVITRVPVLIGQGIPLFGALDKDVKLRHIDTRESGVGMVQSEYEVER